MLILFDLDDTLLDTTGSITPYRLRQILDFLQSNGVRFASIKEAYAKLQEMASVADSTQEAVKKFLESYRIEAKIEAIQDLLSTPLPPDMNVMLCPGAKEILQDLYPFHDLALVTRGFPDLQKQKWEKAGLDTSLFCKIAVVEPTARMGKKTVYELLLKERKKRASEVLVCGDHLTYDLRPAKELGCWTVLMQWGKGKRWKEDTELFDFTISHLGELKSIVAHLQQRKR